MANAIPREVLMVGDNYHQDYSSPKQLGMNAFWLRRENNFVEIKTNDAISGSFETIKNLTELLTKI